MNDYMRSSTLSGVAASPGGDDDWKAEALIFRGVRQALLASNIANADTPNYKARDVSFQDSLSRELAASAIGTSTPATTAGSRIGEESLLPAQSTLSFARFIVPTQSNLDGNTVDMDRERSAIAQNAIMYQFSINSLDDEWKEFKMASSDPRR